MLLDAASLGNGSFPQPRLPAWSEAGRPPPPCWGPRLGPAPPGALQSWRGPQPGGEQRPCPRSARHPGRSRRSPDPTATWKPLRSS